jgi:hypothetical protein
MGSSKMSEWHVAQHIKNRKKRANQRVARQARAGRLNETTQRAAPRAKSRQEKVTTEAETVAVGKATARERNEQCSERRGGQDGGAAGKASARERNERFSERRGGQDVEKRTKQAIQRAARRARR